MHAGMNVFMPEKRVEGGRLLAPTGGMTAPNEMTTTEITAADMDKICADFVDAAKAARELGFDGVQLHCAHGYLLSQFYSPLTNHRKDEYTGESLDGRLRFHTEVLTAIRKAVGDDFPVSIRFGAYDYREGGSSLEEIPEAAKMLVAAGADILDISMGMGGGHMLGQPEEGVFSPLAEIVKKAVNVPVITVGNIHTRQGAENLLQNEKADMTAIGRPIFKDPDFARNMMRKA